MSESVLEAKRLAAERAAEEVQDGMLLGLGTGSTAALFIDAVGRRVAAGLRLTCVATSVASADQAVRLGIEVVSRLDRPLDLTVDGADEIDPQLNLVKGLGGALLREKIVAAASRRMLVIATEEKLVPHLGTRSPLPVEVSPLLWERTAAQVAAVGVEPVLRDDEGEAFVTDNGNYILDCAFSGSRDLDALGASLDRIPGVMGHGLFLGMATEAVIAGAEGVRVLTR